MSEETKDSEITVGIQQLELLEQDGDHLLYLIKGGGKSTGGIGCFALMWNLIVGTIATVMLTAFFTGGMRGGDAPPLFAVGIIVLFLGIGICFAYFWVYMKYGRTLLMVQRGMLGIQNDLFGWTRMKTIPLNPGDTGALSVAYEQNDVPVYQIEFKNDQGRLTFGVGLDSTEQDRLLKEIHQFLGIEGEEIQRLEAAEPPKFSGSENEAREVLESHQLEIQEEQRGEWLIRINPRKTSKNFFVGLGCLSIFAAFWEGFVIFWTIGAAQGSIIFALFSIPFHLVGLAMMGLILFMLLGNSEFRFSHSEFSARWSFIGLGWTSRCPTDQIEDFRIVRRDSSVQDRKFRRGSHESQSTALIVKKKSGGEIKLSLGSEEWTPALVAFLNGLLSDLRRV